MGEVLNVLMVHQGAAAVDPLLQHWTTIANPGNLLLTHGGTEADFQQISHMQKVFVTDRRLRTRDHQRELQSITGVFKRVRDWIATSGRDFEFLYFAEYDHLPLVADLNERQISRLRSEGADALGFDLQRIDGTSHPHYLYHTANPRFHAFFSGISGRTDKTVVLAMLGTGSFWSHDAFDCVARFDEPFPMYQEVYIPTLAHHLGFRLRDYGEQSAFVSAAGDRSSEIAAAGESGAWTLHPVKVRPPLNI